MKDIFSKEQHDYHRELFALMGSSDQEEASNAYGKIYQIFKPLVAGKVISVLPRYFSYHDDIIADVFLKIHTKKYAFNPAYNFNSWLMRLTHNSCLDFVRKEKVRETYDIEDTEEVSDDRSMSYTEDKGVNIDNQYLRDLVEKAMDGLNEKKSNIMRLHYFDGLTMDEISVKIKLGKSAVVDYLVHGRKHLKNNLAQDSIAQLVEH